MVDVRLLSLGNVRFRWYASTAFANAQWPTVAEMNAGQELEQVTLWDNFSVGVQASDTTDAVPIAAKAATARRAAANYGGNSSFWYPGFRADNSNAAALVYAALKNLRTSGYLALSVDGEIGVAGQPASNMTFANGDYVTLMRVVTDEWDDSIVGEDPFYYTRNFLKNGSLASYTVVSTAAPVIAVTPSATTGANGTKIYLTSTVNGRDYTRGMTYSSSNTAVATVSPTGVVTLRTAGSAIISTSLPGSSVAAQTTNLTVT